MRRLPHGYSHDTRGDGRVVHKRYAGPQAAIRRATEIAVLSAISGPVPVPPVRDTPPGALLMDHVAGVNGAELVAAGRAADVLRSCGTMLRRIQQCDVAAVFPDRPVGTVLTHGDYGVNNVLCDPRTGAVTVVLDWEWARPGAPVDDLAWAEWIIRRHHPEAAGELGHLFDGYGERPPWPDRQSAALATCQAMLERPRTPQHAAQGIRRWTEDIARTRTWTEID
ncbi:phosphotransferase family protein [Micromonosporaceae bacterium Da 78-11]